MVVEREATHELYARVVWVDTDSSDWKEIIDQAIVDDVLDRLSPGSGGFRRAGPHLISGRLMAVGYNRARTGSLSGPDCTRFSYQEFDKGLNRQRTIRLRENQVYE